ncbi:MAG: sugar phosphate isomerase/epimerase [Clostridia bacterium]|nr:sugar phosphate isomerase/epimerase [Clostridia bacterium]
MNLKLGIQTYTVREDFSENPEETMHRLKALGFDGIEINISPSSATRPASFFREGLKNADLECFGILVGWNDVQPDLLQGTIDYAKELGTDFIVIGSVPTSLVSTHEDAMKAVEYMCEILKVANSHSLKIGYHNHDTDFTHTINGKPFFEYVFDNTPKEFIMLLDTGNTKAGGYNPEEMLKKYPHRSPYLHIKGYSEEKKYLAYIGEDDIDWNNIIELAINTADSRIFNIEFGGRADYIPMERAEAAFKVIKPILKKYQ